MMVITLRKQVIKMAKVRKINTSGTWMFTMSSNLEIEAYAYKPRHFYILEIETHL